MPKPNTFLLKAQAQARQTIAEQTRVRLAIGMDAALIAANEVLHLGPKRAKEFINAYLLALEDLSELYRDDKDPVMDYGKGKRDEVIRKIVGEENFIPYDRQYGDTYLDELKRIRVLKGDITDDITEC